MSNKVHVVFSIDLVNYLIYDSSIEDFLNEEKAQEIADILSYTYKVPNFHIKGNDIKFSYVFKLFFEHLSKVEKVKTEGIYIKYINQLNLELSERAEQIKVALVIPKELSYWGNKDYFLTFKGYSLNYLFTYQRNRLLIHLKKMLGNLNYYEILKYKNSDYKVFKELRKITKPYIIDRKARAMSKVKDVFEFLKYDFSEFGKNKKYLDIGGGDGSISEAIGKTIGLDKSSIISADVPKVFSVDENRNIEDITYVNLEMNGDLPFKNNEIFLISAFMVLHHLPDIEKSLSEIKRILIKGGFVLIREHDAQTIDDKILIDLEHRIYELVDDKDVKLEKAVKFEKHDGVSYDCGYTDVNLYRSKEEWDSLFKKYNFEKVNIKFKQKNEINNQTKYYYTLYRKL